MKLPVGCFVVVSWWASSIDAFTPVATSGISRSSRLYESAPASSTQSSASSTAAAPGVERNPNFAKLAGGYLFPEISRRRGLYLEATPALPRPLISLGIGDTTQPIPEHILQGLLEGVTKLGAAATYSGYGNEQGNNNLREKIATTLYNGLIEPEEVFVSGTL